MAEKKFIFNKKSKLPIWAIWFLVFVLIISVWIFIYNNYLDKKNSDIDSRIQKIETNISEIEKDPTVELYSLLQINSWLIAELEKRNKVTDYINHLYIIWNVYWMEFSWFSYADWKISSTATVESTQDDWIAYTKITEFIDDYRTSDNAIFDLNFIESFEWMDTMRFNVNFDLK